MTMVFLGATNLEGIQRIFNREYAFAKNNEIIDQFRIGKIMRGGRRPLKEFVKICSEKPVSELWGRFLEKFDFPAIESKLNFLINNSSAIIKCIESTTNQRFKSDIWLSPTFFYLSGYGFPSNIFVGLGSDQRMICVFAEELVHINIFRQDHHTYKNITQNYNCHHTLVLYLTKIILDKFDQSYRNFWGWVNTERNSELWYCSVARQMWEREKPWLEKNYAIASFQTWYRRKLSELLKSKA